MKSAVEVLLHPIRLRIVRSLVPAREATVAELAEGLPDVPPATLYRHVKKLVAAGLISAVSERAVRGATERSYRLCASATAANDMRDVPAQDQLRSFIVFVATLIDDFAAYLDRGKPDYVRDGVGYRMIPLDLTDAEYRRMAKDVSKTIAPYAALAASPKRTERYLSVIAMPAAKRRTAKGDV